MSNNYAKVQLKRLYEPRLVYQGFGCEKDIKQGIESCILLYEPQNPSVAIDLQGVTQGRV